MSCANGAVRFSEVCKVRNNSPRAPLFLPPGFAGSAGQGERENYARSEGRRGECLPEGRLSTHWGPGRRQEPARSRNSLPALTQPPSCKSRRPKSVSCANGKWRHSREENIAPGKESRSSGENSERVFWGGKRKLWAGVPENEGAEECCGVRRGWRFERRKIGGKVPPDGIAAEPRGSCTKVICRSAARRSCSRYSR